MRTQRQFSVEGWSTNSKKHAIPTLILVKMHMLCTLQSQTAKAFVCCKICFFSFNSVLSGYDVLVFQAIITVCTIVVVVIFWEKKEFVLNPEYILIYIFMRDSCFTETAM